VSRGGGLGSFVFAVVAIGVLGVVVTVALYVVAFVGLLGLVGLLCRRPWRRRSWRHRVVRGPVTSMSVPGGVLTVRGELTAAELTGIKVRFEKLAYGVTETVVLVDDAESTREELRALNLPGMAGAFERARRPFAVWSPCPHGVFAAHVLLSRERAALGTAGWCELPAEVSRFLAGDSMLVARECRGCERPTRWFETS
jgi:hypothetical protein